MAHGRRRWNISANTKTLADSPWCHFVGVRRVCAFNISRQGLLATSSQADFVISSGKLPQDTKLWYMESGTQGASMEWGSPPESRVSIVLLLNNILMAFRSVILNNLILSSFRPTSFVLYNTKYKAIESTHKYWQSSSFHRRQGRVHYHYCELSRRRNTFWLICLNLSELFFKLSLPHDISECQLSRNA